MDYGVEFSWRASDPYLADDPLNIVAWIDSSFADDKDTARTTCGHVIKVNDATISSSNKLSTRVDSCFNHSELRGFDQVVSNTTGTSSEASALTDGASVSMTNTDHNVTWVRGIKGDLELRDVATLPPTPIRVDNADVLSMINGTTLNSF